MNCKFFNKTSFPMDIGFHYKEDGIHAFMSPEIGSGCNINTCMYKESIISWKYNSL